MFSDLYQDKRLWNSERIIDEIHNGQTGRRGQLLRPSNWLKCVLLDWTSVRLGQS
jgi:hypothetical protein